MSAFLSHEELAQLTGRKIKSKQAEWLRLEGIPFRISATGHPVVLWSALDSTRTEKAPASAWTPRVLQRA